MPGLGESPAASLANLIKYCKLDSEGMTWVMDELRRVPS
jgi:hypothetical protein